MTSTRFNCDEIKRAAAGQWKLIVERLGVNFDAKGHQPCPKCGGKDRFRPFDDFNQTGGVICGAGGCNKSCSDGIETVMHYCGLEFPDALEQIADILGIQPAVPKKKTPLEKLQLDSEINEILVAMFLANNEGITAEGLERMGAMTGSYEGQAVVAFPCWSGSENPTNWVLMSATSKKMWHRENKRDVQVRKKTLAKGHGLMGSVDDLPTAGLIWKCEGPTDCAALLSALPESAVTNIHGAGESPDRMVESFRGLVVNIVHDADKAGQAGAEKWIEALRRVGCSVRNVRLPDEYDVRRFLIERSGQALVDLANQAELLGPIGSAVSAASGEQPGTATVDVIDCPYDRRLVPDECIEILDRLMLEVVCQDDEGAVTVYSRATGLVRTLKYAEKLQLPNLLMFGGMPCYQNVTDAMDDDDASKIHLREVRKAIGIAASAQKIEGKVDLRGHGIYSTGGDVVVCNGKYLSVYTQDGRWVRTDRPFYRDLVFSFCGDSGTWYDHDELGRCIEMAKDPKWAKPWIVELESIIDRWSWENPKIDPIMIASLVLASFVQQSWEWRPQVSIRGQSNSGKSVLFQFLFGSEHCSVGVFNGMSMKVALSSAAGIRQKMRSSSLILGIDEFDQLKKPQDLLNLIRTAGRGEKLIMGSTHHKHYEFGLKNICWLAGIFVGLDAEADQNRFLEFSLVTPKEPKRSRFAQPTKEEIKRLQMPLIAIAIAHAEKAARMSKESFMASKEGEKGLNERVVESISVPSSMLASATGGDVNQAVAYIRAFADPRRSEIDIISNHDELIIEILQLTIDIGGGSKVSVSQAVCLPEYATHRRQVALQIGVTRKSDDRGNEWLIVHPARVLKRLQGIGDDKMATKGAIRQLLLRVDGAIKNRAYLEGVQCQCVWIPWSYVSKNIEQESGDDF